MKLTKSKLQQIIKEELNSVLENEDWYSDEHETVADQKYADRPSDTMADENVVDNQQSDSRAVELLTRDLTGILRGDIGLNYLSRMNGLSDEELGRALKSASEKAEDFRSAAPSPGESAAHDRDPERFTSGT